MSVRERTARRAVPTQGREAELKGRPGTGEAELKGGSRGEPDSWMGTSIFRCRVTGTGIGSSGFGPSGIGSGIPDSDG